MSNYPSSTPTPEEYLRQYVDYYKNVLNGNITLYADGSGFISADTDDFDEADEVFEASALDFLADAISTEVKFNDNDEVILAEITTQVGGPTVVIDVLNQVITATGSGARIVEHYDVDVYNLLDELVELERNYIAP